MRIELSALLDGALSEERAAELRRLIEEDAELRREYEALVRTVAAVRDLPRVSAPPELRRGVLAATARRGIAPIYKWGGLATAVAATLVLAVMVKTGEDAPGPITTTASEPKPPVMDEPSRKWDRFEKKKDEPVAEEKVEAARDFEEREDVAKTKKPDRPGGRLRRAKAQVEDADDGLSILRDVERGELKTLAKRRPAYLVELKKRSDKEIASHFRALEGSERFRGQAKRKVAPGQPKATVILGSEEEARALQGILLRTFPVTPEPQREAEEDAGKGGGGAPGKSVKRARSEITVEVEATPDDMARILLWLGKVGDRTGRPTALSSPSVKRKKSGSRAAGLAGEAAPARKFRIRIVYAAPPGARREK